MAITKADLFEQKDKRLAKIAKAISHPARIAILKHLSHGQCVCGDITHALPLAQSTVSQHLKALKSAGLITGEIEGVKVCYCLNAKTIREAREVVTELFETLNLNDCC